MNSKQDILNAFREKFTVFDGSQNIVKHVTYSSWVEQWLLNTLTEFEREVREEALKKLGQDLEITDGEEMIETEMIRDYITETIAELKT